MEHFDFIDGILRRIPSIMECVVVFDVVCLMVLAPQSLAVPDRGKFASTLSPLTQQHEYHFTSPLC